LHVSENIGKDKIFTTTAKFELFILFRHV